jgi:hypothetical protein
MPAEFESFVDEEVAAMNAENQEGEYDATL